VIKKFVVHRHYENKHSKEYAKYVDEEKSNLIEGLKLIYEDGSISHVDNMKTSIKALTASYAISNLIAKNSKPFCEGKFVKECSSQWSRLEFRLLKKLLAFL
jgi:cell division protein FtsI/penicillin-binding protein 2